MSPTHQRRREHEAAFGTARDGVAVIAPDWRIRYMNASMLEILRLIGHAARVETLWDALPGWEASDAADALRQAMAAAAPVCFRVDGERGRGRVWEVEAEPLDTGELRLRVRNVTSLARAEEAERARAPKGSLAEADREARLDAIVSGAPVGIVLLDAATLLVREANAFYHQFLEGPFRVPGAIVGHALQEFIPGADESGVTAIFRRVAETREPFHIAEFEFHGFERGTTFFRWTLQPLGRTAAGQADFLLLLVVEITEQVKARRAVEAERKALYDVLDTLPVGVLVAEAPGGTTVYLNSAAAELGGRAREELSADEAAEYSGRWQAFLPSGEPFPPDELPIARALRGEATEDTEVVLRPPNGAERTVVVSGVPLRDAAGEVDRGVVAFYDVTERLALERELLQRTREAEEAASEAALRADESRTLREITRALASELEPQQVLERAVRSAMELLASRAALVALPQPSGEVRLGTAVGALADLAGRDLPPDGTVTGAVLQDGVSRVYNDAADLARESSLGALVAERGLRNAALVPLRAFGERLGVLAVVDRATPFSADDLKLLEGLADTAALAIHNAGVYARERRRAEENRALLAAAEVLASTLDVDEVMQKIATIARELANAEGAGLTMFDEGRERTQMRAAVGLLEPLAGGGGPAEGTITAMIAEGGVPRRLRMDEVSGAVAGRDVLRALGVEYAAMVPVRAGDEVVGVLAVVNSAARGEFDDEQLRVVSLLADQAALSVRNARLYAVAQAGSRAKSEFLAMMSHELRTPLNALEGYASLIEEGIYGPVTDAQLEAMRRMRVSRRHLMELIDSVLDLARVEAGTRKAEPQEVDLRALVESIGEAMRGAAVAKKLELEVDAARAGRICTDPGLLRQVLTNLVGNAIKFTAAGRVAVRAWTEDGRSTMEVEDTGPGIAPENQRRVFERFFQVDPSITRKEGGTGLGLALSHDFVALLAGEISVRSTLGRGSTFTVVLPA